MNTTRPATETTSSVSCPVSRYAHCARTSRRACVRGTDDRVRLPPGRQQRARFSWRTRICSGTSGSGGGWWAGWAPAKGSRGRRMPPPRFRRLHSRAPEPCAVTPHPLRARSNPGGVRRAPSRTGAAPFTRAVTNGPIRSTHGGRPRELRAGSRFRRDDRLRRATSDRPTPPCTRPFGRATPDELRSIAESLANNYSQAGVTFDVGGVERPVPPGRRAAGHPGRRLGDHRLRRRPSGSGRWRPSWPTSTPMAR